MTKKHIKYLVFLMLLAAPLAVLGGKFALPARADEAATSSNSSVVSHEGRDQNNDEGDIEQEENDLHAGINGQQAGLQQIQVPEVREESIYTYADAVKLLQQYQSILAALPSPTSAPASLSVAEQALLGKLQNRHQAYFSARNARINELNSQIADLLSVLTPLGDQAITDNGGLRKLLIETLKNIQQQAEKLTELTDLDFEIVDNETM